MGREVKSESFDGGGRFENNKNKNHLGSRCIMQYRILRPVK